MGMPGTKGMGPLECPECGGEILWTGSQHVCASCAWKEHVARPPSDPKLPAQTTPKGEEED